jgi:hypothetical protein
MSNRDNTGSTNRRTLLAILGTGSISALAGCGSNTPSAQGEVSEKHVPAPSLDVGEKWELVTPDSKPRVMQKGSISLLDWTAVGHTVQYEHTRLRERIKEDTFGEVDRPLVMAFAARVDIFPRQASFATGIKSGKIDDSLSSNLKSAMEEFGVKNVSQQSPIEDPNLPAKKLQVITGEYPIDAVTIEGVDIPHSDRTQLKFGGNRLPIQGVIGRWKEGGSILAGGGVYPLQDFEQNREINMSDSISLEIGIDLGLSPRTHKNEVFDFIRSVSK